MNSCVTEPVATLDIAQNVLLFNKNPAIFSNSQTSTWMKLVGDPLAEKELAFDGEGQSTEEEDFHELFMNDPQDAFDQIVLRYRKLVFCTSYSVLRNTESALDATQEVFLKVYKSFSSFEGRSKFRTWLYRITINHCLNLLRSQMRRKDTISLDERIETPSSNKDNPRKNLENAELREKIESAIEQLPKQQKIIFILRNDNDLTFDEISGILGKSVGGIKASYFHAVRKMREILLATKGDV